MDRGHLPVALGVVQAIVVVAALAVVPLVPPAEGMILLAPLSGEPLGHMITLARAHDATIVGSGPWAGSIVVSGKRAALFSAMTRAGVLMIAAPGSACGGKRA